MDDVGCARMKTEIKIGAEIPSQSFPITREDLLAYAGASGDQNPIHQNEEFAKSVGLPNVIAHGMYTMAIAGRYVSQWAGGSSRIKEFSVRFTKPVLVPAGAKVELIVSGVIFEISARHVKIDITVECDGVKVLGMAKATIQLL